MTGKKPPMAGPRRVQSEADRRSAEQVALGHAAGEQEEFERTGNPLHLWLALDGISAMNRDRERAGEEPLPIPAWIARELGYIARRMADTAAGTDWRQAPAPFGTIPIPQKPRGEWTEADARQAGAALEAARKRPIMKDAKAASALSAQALGFTSRGKNAFEAYWSRQADLTDAASVAMWRTSEHGVAFVRDTELDNAAKVHVAPVQPVSRKLAVDWLAASSKETGKAPGRRARRATAAASADAEANAEENARRSAERRLERAKSPRKFTD